MPTRKPRINLSVDDDLNQLLDELSQLTGKPKATLVMELLRESKPALMTMKRGLKMAKTSREKAAQNIMLELLSQANQTAATMNKEMAEMISSQIDRVGHD